MQIRLAILLGTHLMEQFVNVGGNISMKCDTNDSYDLVMNASIFRFSIISFFGLCVVLDIHSVTAKDTHYYHEKNVY